MKENCAKATTAGWNGSRTNEKGKTQWGKVSIGNGRVGVLSGVQEGRTTRNATRGRQKGIGTRIRARNIEKGTGLTKAYLR